MGESLREVSQGLAAMPGLFRIEADMVGKHPLENQSRLFEPRPVVAAGPGRQSRCELLRGSPPLSGASVLSSSRLEPLVPFPLASPARFSRSVQVDHRHCRPAANETMLGLRRAVGTEVVHWLGANKPTISDDVGLTLQAKLTPAYCDDFLGPHLIITLPIG